MVYIAILLSITALIKSTFFPSKNVDIDPYYKNKIYKIDLDVEKLNKSIKEIKEVVEI